MEGSSLSQTTPVWNFVNSKTKELHELSQGTPVSRVSESAQSRFVVCCLGNALKAPSFEQLSWMIWCLSAVQDLGEDSISQFGCGSHDVTLHGASDRPLEVLLAVHVALDDLAALEGDGQFG